MEPKNIIILGGGLSGLAAADKLLDAGQKVTILEKAPFLGGLASSFRMEGEDIPKYYHHIVSHNSKTIEYLKRYHAMDPHEWKRIKVAIGVDGKLKNINTVPGLLGFSYLSLYGRFRFGLFGFYALFMMNPSL